MAYLGQIYDQETLPQGEEFDPIPSGVYTAAIKEADLKDTKSGTGQYINIRWDVIGPKHAGRVVFDTINIVNQNPKAVEIAQQQLGSLLRATGLRRVQDTDELIGAVCQIKVGLSKVTPEYPEPKNEVKGYKELEGGYMPKPTAPSGFAAPAQPAAAPPAQQQAPGPQASGGAQGNTPPWERNK